MNIFLVILAVLFALGGLGAFIFVLVEMFQDEVWKGVLGLLCGFYWLYYAIVEFDHDWKWVIILVGLGGNGIAAGLLRMAGAG
ncbi:MAG: hypothetical protein ABL949_11280 [Fimbriimonadaceae bacterium]